ncbi:MAG: acetoacetate--CoA ligase family protein [Acidimicrobiia bacterium]|nr:acetoacetate--CoA ligase family protein [Acidimicrobiia bacterium]
MNRKDACFRATSRIYSYLDNEIRTLRRIRIRLHLRQCLKCKRAFGFEQRLISFVRERSYVEAPPDVVEKIRRAIRERGR